MYSFVIPWDRVMSLAMSEQLGQSDRGRLISRNRLELFANVHYRQFI